jgi:hypothetical protein
MMFQPEKFSDYIAILALLVSCASFYLSWRNFRRDRSSLKLSMDFEGRPDHGLSYRVTVTNNGRRPATLMEVRALFWFRESQVVFEQETLLEEGRNKVIFVPFAMIPFPNPLAVRGFEARDSLGNKYHTNTLGLYWKILLTQK